jgi:hypothetical protein
MLTLVLTLTIAGSIIKVIYIFNVKNASIQNSTSMWGLACHYWT